MIHISIQKCRNTKHYVFLLVYFCILRKLTNKTSISNNNHHIIGTFIEATRNEINNENEKTIQPNYPNLSVKEQKSLKELQSRDDNVITELLPRITWRKVIIHKHSKRQRYKGCKKSLDNHPKQAVVTKVITTFLALILTLSNFIFNSNNYRHTKGCAMGTICAPSYSNIFMDHFEKKLYTHLSKVSHWSISNLLETYFLYRLAIGTI